MSWTVKCQNCGERKHRYKPCESCGFANGNENVKQSVSWGEFAVTDETIDVIDMILDADIRAARNRMHKKIENEQLNIDQPFSGGVNEQNIHGQALSPAAKKFAKVITDLHAIQKQAQRF